MILYYWKSSISETFRAKYGNVLPSSLINTTNSLSKPKFLISSCTGSAFRSASIPVSLTTCPPVLSKVKLIACTTLFNCNSLPFASSNFLFSKSVNSFSVSIFKFGIFNSSASINSLLPLKFWDSGVIFS